MYKKYGVVGQPKPNTTPERKFNGADKVKPAPHCNNGKWVGAVQYGQFMHGEWWYKIDNTWWAESTLVLATKDD